MNRQSERARTMALHNTQELDDDLRGRADEHLALAATLGVDDVVLHRHECRGLDHSDGTVLTRQSF